MKPVLFCSFLIAFFGFSCKPKPLDNLKEVARQVEERKVRRVSRAQLAKETQRVADSVLTAVVLSARQKFLTGNTKSDLSCVFREYAAYQEFQAKYHGRVEVVFEAPALAKLQTEIAGYRKFNNQLPENKPGFPAVFQTQTDTVLYVRQIIAGQKLCERSPESGFWVFRMPKQKLIEIMTVKVKPKPAKGPNW